jgi:cytochrome c biogenesis protein
MTTPTPPTPPSTPVVVSTRSMEGDELDVEGHAAIMAAHQAPRGLSRVYALLWSFMCSLPRALKLMMMLGVACFVGMFFDQTLTYEQHAAQWASQAWKLKLFTFLEMNDVFSSWWFVLIIAYLLIAITACSIERFPKIYLDALNPKRDLDDDQLAGIKHVYRKTVSGQDAAAVSSLFSRIFGARAYQRTQGAVTTLFFEKHRFARFGVYIIHAGLMMIFSGGILVNFTKIDGMMMVTEGRSGHMVRVWGPGRLPYSHELNFEVRCVDFRLKTFIDGAPMEFESDLEVIDPKSPVNPVLRKTIQVNDPLEYGGYTFYQASYNPIPGDQKVQLDVGVRGQDRKTFIVDIGERIDMADGTSFMPIEVVQNYAGLGAAVRVQETSAAGVVTTYFVFRSYPSFDRDVRRGLYDVQFRGFDQQYATGLQVGRVPFIPLVFAGFLVMFVGMYMAFFLSHRRYWARATTLANGTLEVVFGGAARRHQYAFEEEFSGLNELWTAAFGAAESKADRARALRAQRASSPSSSSPTEK